jgi:ABC-type antimicrobial peptide transport system permease subunit
VLLAAIGLYGLISFVVAQRTREVGIRLAVGARPGQIVSLILRRGMLPVAVGCAVGVALVLLAGGVLNSIVYGISASDPLAIGGAVVAFMLVAVAAALVPARRAARSDPSAALRQE